MTTVDVKTRGARPDRPLSFVEAYSTLRGAQKTARGAPAYSRWVNRPIGRVLAAAAYRIGLVPNQVTAISALVTYSGIAVLALVRPSASISVLVALLLLLGYALDSADGQLARLTRLGRPSGEWLDHVIDMGKTCLLHGAVALSWVRWGVPGLDADWADLWAVGIPLLFLTVAVVGFFAWLLSDVLIRVARAGQRSRAAGETTPAVPGTAAAQPAPVLRSLLRLPGDYGLLALTFVLFALPAFPVAYALLLLANAVILLAALPVWFSQVRASEEAG